MSVTPGALIMCGVAALLYFGLLGYRFRDPPPYETWRGLETNADAWASLRIVPPSPTVMLGSAAAMIAPLVAPPAWMSGAWGQMLLSVAVLAALQAVRGPEIVGGGLLERPIWYSLWRKVQNAMETLVMGAVVGGLAWLLGSLGLELVPDRIFARPADLPGAEASRHAAVAAAAWFVALYYLIWRLVAPAYLMFMTIDVFDVKARGPALRRAYLPLAAVALASAWIVLGLVAEYARHLSGGGLHFIALMALSAIRPSDET